MLLWLRRLLAWLWHTTVDIVREYRKDGVGDLAASITFWTMVTIPALVLALLSLLGYLDAIIGRNLAADIEREVRDFVNSTFSDNAQSIVNAIDELFARSNTGIATAAFAVALYSLSSGFAGLIRALERAYGVPRGRAWWQARIVGAILGMGTLAVLIATALLVELLPQFAGGRLGRLGFGALAVMLVGIWITVLFHAGPNQRSPWRYHVPGGAFAAIGWVLAIRGFSFYVRNLDKGNRVQTSVGAILLTLTLVYVMSTILLVGAELNAVLAHRAGVVELRDPWRRPGWLPPRESGRPT